MKANALALNGRKWNIGLLSVTLLSTILVASCTTIRADEWVLDDAHSDITSISKPYWSALIADDENGSSSDGYFVLSSTSGSASSRVWIAESHSFAKGAEEKIWLRFRAVSGEVLVIQATRYDSEGRSIELYPLRKVDEQVYRLYSMENDKAMAWAKKQPLATELGKHLTFTDYTIRFDAYASQKYAAEIIELIGDFDQAGLYEEDAYIEFRGFATLDALKAYVEGKVKKMK